MTPWPCRNAFLTSPSYSLPFGLHHELRGQNHYSGPAVFANAANLIALKGALVFGAVGPAKVAGAVHPSIEPLSLVQFSRLHHRPSIAMVAAFVLVAFVLFNHESGVIDCHHRFSRLKQNKKCAALDLLFILLISTEASLNSACSAEPKPPWPSLNSVERPAGVASWPARRPLGHPKSRDAVQNFFPATSPNRRLEFHSVRTIAALE